eukprot:NODE_27703_length_504_cov_0.840849.p2 GENE.NODE_27703_length_504_cov_0.840849~~NODE_27703_length_504_cov_0.840849.p2  ORF type:complete len:50 (-),score=2.87 NODE_27703_length_504_cov_0.840849:137-286(-)
MPGIAQAPGEHCSCTCQAAARGLPGFRLGGEDLSDAVPWARSQDQSVGL